MILVISVIIPLILAAQVQLMDLSVKPLMSSNINPDSVQVLIQFKMNPVSQAQSVQFSFGIQTGISDVFSDVASVSQQGPGYSVVYNGIETPVRNYNSQIYCTLSQSQYTSWLKLTVFVNDNTGGQSNHLIWNK